MMNNYTLVKRITLFLFFVAIASSLFGQSQLRVAIFPVINNTNLPYINALSITAEDNIHFMMTQLENYNLVDERKTKLPSFQINDLREAAKGKKCDYIIYGSISGQSPFTLSLFLFERGSNKIIAKRVGTIQRMTEVYSLSDQLALALLEDLTGKQITRGELQVVNTGAPGSFTVSINNRTLDAGVSSILLMEGKYKIKIEGLNGKKKKTLHSGKFIIEEGGQTLVEFAFPVWGKGKLTFNNTGTKTDGNYSVNIDGTPVENNIPEYLIKTGRHKVEIFNADEEKKIYSKNVTVKEGKETKISFELNLPKMGTIFLLNKGNPGTYEVTLDGKSLGNNIQQFTTQKGPHRIEVFEIVENKKNRVSSRKITVKDKSKSTVSFKLEGTQTVKTTSAKPKKTVKKKSKPRSNLNTSVVRLLAGGTFLQEANFNDLSFIEGNIPGGDIGYMKIGYSVCGSSGIGFTTGFTLGIGGFWQDSGLYSTDETTETYTGDIFLGFDLGLYFRTSIIGFYPVLTFGYNSGNIDEETINHYLFGATLGIDLFIISSMPITFEFGIVGGWGDNEATGEGLGDIDGFTVGVGIGLDL